MSLILRVDSFCVCQELRRVTETRLCWCVCVCVFEESLMVHLIRGDNDRWCCVGVYLTVSSLINASLITRDALQVDVFERRTFDPTTPEVLKCVSQETTLKQG